MDDNKINTKELAAAIALPLAVGGLSALLTNNGMKEFAALRQPPLPPAGLGFSRRVDGTLRNDGNGVV